MKKNRMALLLCGCLIAGALSGCNGHTSGPIVEDIVEEQEGTVTPAADQETGSGTGEQEGAAASGLEETVMGYGLNEKAVAMTQEGIGEDLEILAALGAAAGKENVIYSPVSLHTAMALYGEMLEDGDAKKNLQEYLRGKSYLGYRYDHTDVYKSLNTVWANTNKDLHFESLGDAFPLRMIDMSDPSATDVKNQYVNDATEGFIPSTPTIFTSDTVMDVMNVLYFHDTWMGGDLEEFRDYKEFHNADGTTRSFDYMIGMEMESYLKGQSSVGACLPYENGMEFFVVLPNEEDADPASLAADIADYILKPAATLQTQSEEGGSLNVHVRFPEFESKYTTFFEGTKIPGLVASPISPAIYDGDLMTQISQVAKIKVDKEGTTAAAVTEITLTDSAMPPAPPEEVNIICDRPFVYFIYDPVNQDIAFLGYVRNL